MTIRPWVQCQHCGAVWMLRTRKLSRQCSACSRRDWRADGAEPRRDLPRGKLARRFHVCLRCGHVWIHRLHAAGWLPTRCPDCMSAYWNQPPEVRSAREVS
jgi:predicted  nucleic acid-binding Zn-ribbon protein